MSGSAFLQPQGQLARLRPYQRKKNMRLTHRASFSSGPPAAIAAGMRYFVAARRKRIGSRVQRKRFWQAVSRPAPPMRSCTPPAGGISKLAAPPALAPLLRSSLWIAPGKQGSGTAELLFNKDEGHLGQTFELAQLVSAPVRPTLKGMLVACEGCQYQQ